MPSRQSNGPANSSSDPGTGRPIAFFIPTLGGGGAQRVVVNLANALVGAVSRPIHVVLVSKSGPFAEMLDSRVAIVDLGCRRTAWSVPGLTRYLRRERPQVVMSSMNYANAVCALAHRLAGRPGRLVLREATIFQLQNPRPRGANRPTLLLAAMRVTYRWADTIVANSVDTKESLLAAGIGRGAHHVVIGNPVAVDDPAEHPEPTGSPRPFVCGIGRLVADKGFDVLLEAMAKCRFEDWHLVLLGEGPERAFLMNRAAELGLEQRVHLPGFQTHPAAYLREAELFVLSSRWEGFGNVLVEALAAGVPIISTDCPGGPRTILEDGQHGRLVPVDDPAALARAIDDTLERPVGTPEARRARAAKFSPERIAKEYLDKALLPGTD